MAFMIWTVSVEEIIQYVHIMGPSCRSVGCRCKVRACIFFGALGCTNIVSVPMYTVCTFFLSARRFTCIYAHRAYKGSTPF